MYSVFVCVCYILWAYIFGEACFQCQYEQTTPYSLLALAKITIGQFVFWLPVAH